MYKLITCSIFLATIFACGTVQNSISYHPDHVASIGVFSEVGGRVDWNSTTNKIVYDQETKGRWDIIIGNESRSIQENITEDMTGKTYGDQTIQSWQHRGQPAFDPSGKYIIFQVMNEHAHNEPKTNELLSLGVNNDLWFMHADGSHKKKLTNNPEGYSVLHPHFSHDGKHIIWAEKYNDDNSASNFGAWRIRLAEITIDENGEAFLENLQSVQPGGEKWYETHGFSKDDSKIFFSANIQTDPKANDIFSYDLSTEQLTNLTNQPHSWQEMHNINPKNPGVYSFISSEFFDWNNKWGWATLRTELYINDHGTIKQLTFYNQLEKDNSNELTKEHYLIGDHCWSPDGKTLLAVLANVQLGNTTSKIIKINLK